MPINKKNFTHFFVKIEQIPALLFLAKWLFFAILIGFLVGCASAFFLVSLEWLTQWREKNVWIITLLPLGGFGIGLVYHYFGNEVIKGNNLLLDEFHKPTQITPFKMAPLILLTTLVTHFFGGSAGREGTAVQMGGTIADQLTHLFKFTPSDRKIVLCMDISAGFASVFGTPLAGTIFALEVFVIGKMRYEALLPCLFSAFIADYTCHAWQVAHTHYSIPFVPPMTMQNFAWTILVGIFCGLTALIFSKSTHFFTHLFKSNIKYPPLRPFLGGIIIALAVWFLGTKYIGLGIPTISDAFSKELNHYDFLLKILFTSFTLGAGFKGGEVTPLFYIGATLGNALAWFVPLPMALLAGMCFVAVFSGASNTPITCTFMGLELFGAEGAMYIFAACIVSYFFSGHKGIYQAQIAENSKYPLDYFLNQNNERDNK